MAPSAATSAHAAADIVGYEGGTWGSAARSDEYGGYEEGAAAAAWHEQGAMAGFDCSNMQSSEVSAGVTDWDGRHSGVWAGHAGDQVEVGQEQRRSSAASLSSSSVVGCLPLASGGRQQAVEDLLQANARLLQKLAK
jgi:hypothetical protein